LKTGKSFSGTSEKKGIGNNFFKDDVKMTHNFAAGAPFYVQTTHQEDFEAGNPPWRTEWNEPFHHFYDWDEVSIYMDPRYGRLDREATLFFLKSMVERKTNEDSVWTEKNGYMHGRYVEYWLDNNGSPVDIRTEFQLHLPPEHFRIKKTEQWYKNGFKDGLEQTWYSNGKPLRQLTWKNRNLDGLETQWHSNGQKWIERTWKDGELDGLERIWHINGRKAVEQTWKNGNLDGLETQWHSNGQKWIERTWKEGHMDGLETQWWDNGRIKTERTWKDGILDGLERTWYENVFGANVV